MIAWLQGVLREKQPPWLLVDVGGVGYELQASMTTFSALPKTGAEIGLFAHQVVRDDDHQLCGFADRNERDVFRQLLKVNGVGAKVALAILSGMDTATLTRCILDEDTTSLARLPGIGKKTADRLVIDMRDRLGPLPVSGSSGPSAGGGLPDVPADPAAEAVSALISLGLKAPEARRGPRLRGHRPTGPEGHGQITFSRAKAALSPSPLAVYHLAGVRGGRNSQECSPFRPRCDTVSPASSHSLMAGIASRAVAPGCT